ncbi:dihydrodipicolinate synthase family protein [Lentibacillus populi]|uniref:Dihydrodipicolinate synthase family protein n=1 Tax=Lentibacillus populi TaxID=1827502 RepID=A0A9W5X4X5_9BACI|nr:dihydrodipicolinate synthase family protein [Lentibacillus populi]GGB38941.1 dihydrodipicolinate synthase family protein [Lentibacillus populi]
MDYASFSEKLAAVSAINIVPFHCETKDINWEGLEENINFLIKHGLKVIVSNGNTGEFYGLPLAEAKEVTKKVVEIVDGRATVIAGIGYSVGTAIELGKAAQRDGADGVMIHQPIHPYITEDGAVDYFKNIINELDIPSVIYFKNPNLSDDVIHRLAPLEKFAGVKYAINDLQRLTKAIRQTPKSSNIAWICGTAEKWAPFFHHSGTVGFTSGLVNVNPEKSLVLFDALQEGDQQLVWDIWEEILPFENLRAKYNDGNNVVVIKEAMEQLGLTAGITREPVGPLHENDKKELFTILNKWSKISKTQA